MLVATQCWPRQAVADFASWMDLQDLRQRNNRDVMIQQRPYKILSALHGKRWEFLWLCGLIMSFAYELPIWYVTSMDRVNPRLFDVMCFLGIVFVLRKLPPGPSNNSLFCIWAAIVVVFCCCALIWTVGFLPWEYGKFSLFFAAKYVWGLMAIYIAIRIPLDVHEKRIIHYVVVAGGVFVALYSIGQFGSGQTEWAITGEESVISHGGAIYGSLSRSYFHVGMFSTLSFAMTLALVSAFRGHYRSWLFLGLAFFVAWPALACGSRAAIGGIVIVMVTSVFLDPKLIPKSCCLAVLGMIMIYATGMDKKGIDLDETSLGYKRFIMYEDSQNSVLNRIMLRFDMKHYMYDGWPVPFFGAGFYVAPVSDGTGSYYYRVGYGIHNVYLFSFEQGGIAGFVLFIVFLVRTMGCLNQMRKSGVPIDTGFAFGVFTFMAALLAVGFAGQVFWRGFNSENFNTYIVLLLVLGTSQTSIGTEAVRKQSLGF